MEYSLYSLDSIRKESQHSNTLEVSEKNQKIIINGMFLNTDLSLLSLATDNGYRIFETYNFNLVSEVDEIQNMIGSLKIVIPFYQSNILILVGKDKNSTFSDTQLILWDDSKKKKVGVILLKEDIIVYDVKITKQAYFILLKNKILVFSVSGLKYLTTIYDIECCRGVNDKLVMTYFNPITILNKQLARNNQIKITKCNKV
jgi:hypothetical protein